MPKDEQAEITADARKYAKAMHAPLIFCSSSHGINVLKVRVMQSEAAWQSLACKAAIVCRQDAASVLTPALACPSTSLQLFKLVFEHVFSIEPDVEQKHAVGEPILEY